MICYTQLWNLLQQGSSDQNVSGLITVACRYVMASPSGTSAHSESLFTSQPDRLHKTEPKHQTEKMEGMVENKEQTSSSVCTPPSIPSSVRPHSPHLSLPAFHDYFHPKNLAAPPPLLLLLLPPAAACPYLCQEPHQSLAAAPFINLSVPRSFHVCLTPV